MVTTEPKLAQISPETRERGRQLYEQEGLGWRAIAERLQVKPHTVRGWITRYGWAAPKRAVRDSMVAAARVTAAELGSKHAKSAARFVEQTIDDCKSLRTKGLQLLDNDGMDFQDYRSLVLGLEGVVRMARTAYGLDQTTQGPSTLVNLSITGATSIDPLAEAKPVIPVDSEPSTR